MIWTILLICIISAVVNSKMKKKIKQIDNNSKSLPQEEIVPENKNLKTAYLISNIVFFVSLGLLIYLRLF